ncbi:hypothetical protein CDCA_CDCA02G0736 [Cyanidium caldarium]|uniref:Uncharacterized protein n=1 Tax=Cyanidium caldarium TaxID=2771 RepID=A0AAV9IR89_CYACA|nr:hypothetical protein CDCA_CDCA02G0736 [Cyanidium caldarium]
MSLPVVYLSIDVGTSSARAAVIDARGVCYARSESPFPTRHQRPGFYEQSSVLILQAVGEAVRSCLAEAAARCVTLAEDEPNSLPPGSLAEVVIGGMGVDATCSLVVSSPAQVEFFTNCSSVEPSSPLLASVPGGVDVRDCPQAPDPQQPSVVWDVVLWMDHRAEAEVEEINADSSPITAAILRFYGGRMSAENEPPKLVWLARHRPEVLQQAGAVMDLSDFVVFALTGNRDARGLCPIAAKWAYRTDEMRWDRAFYERWGLASLLERGAMGRDAILPGKPVPCGVRAGGLTAFGAALLGAGADSAIRDDQRAPTMRETGGQSGRCHRIYLSPGRRAFCWDVSSTVVASGMVDAHAGALGALSLPVPDRTSIASTAAAAQSNGNRQAAQTAAADRLNDATSYSYAQRIAVICGTSTCHMVSSPHPVYVPGTWGPHRSALLPDMWLTEGGQSVTGHLLDSLLEAHAPAVNLAHLSLDALHQRMAALAPACHAATARMHVYPDFHGNRAPLADARMTGAVVGLQMDTLHTERGLATLYLAAVQALVYGTRQIIEAMNSAGHDIRIVMLCGGMLKNRLLVETMADGCELPVVHADPREDMMLLGDAVCAHAAHAHQGDLLAAIIAMQGDGGARAVYRLDPRPERVPFHRAKYRVFLRMQQDQIAYRREMQAVSGEETTGA